VRVFILPEPPGVSGAYFVALRLTGSDGGTLGRNFYWLSTHPDVLADTSTWYMTPVTQYADYTALAHMPPATVTATARFTRAAGNTRARVTLTNPGRTVAFFLRLQLAGRGGQEALPVFWEDNYVSLLPGETRTLVATVRTRDLGGAAPHVIVSGWNVRRTMAR
jgi:exo-1,4-beta-D-glucosaminidase